MFTLTMQTDNAAFDPGEEIARILRTVADVVAEGIHPGGGSLRCLNGNPVGEWRYMAPTEREPVAPHIRDDDKRNRMALVAILARIRPDISSHHVAADVEELARLGRRAHLHAERLCSYEWYTKDKPEDFDEVTRARIGKKAAPLAAKYGLSVTVGGDPRGYCFYLHGIKGNTWGGDESGYGIK